MPRHVICIALLVGFTSCLYGEEVRTWEGTWQNRKYDTRGPLKCVAQEVSPGKWKAKFTGKFQGDPFTYEAAFSSREGKNGQNQLSGKATIRGHRYQWTGLMNREGLRGKYDSSVGYHGEFVLKAND